MSSKASRRKTSFGSSSSARTSRSWSSYQPPSDIAFSKMVGLDVTPTTASSSMRHFSSPVRSHSRESASIHTLCPSSLSSWSRDLDIQTFPFHRFDLFKPAPVPLAAVERRCQEGADELGREVGADDAGADAEHVHVVVLDTLVC